MITIVIPVHNRKTLTQQCLGYLAAQTYRNFRVIVVDDGSTDGTSQMIQDEFPDTLIIRGTGNLWWTEATNWGIRFAQEHPAPGYEEHFILTLNDDTVVRPDYLQTLLDTYEQHKPCLVGSPSADVNSPEKLRFAGTHMELWFASGRDAAADYNYDYNELLRRTDFVQSDSLPGRGTLIPMSVFDKIGLYDSKRFSHYMSDIEFSVRAKKAGFPLIISTKSMVLEYTDATGLFLSAKEKETWKDFVTSFTSIRSPTNLTVRYNFALAHGKTKHLYFLVDVLRISMGFLKRKYLMAK
ncbi:glycosyltransferase family 2 protein [Fibrella sp. HMF5335]|uniref:Glycosyltransferase family 2 protein n=1 Tax=Fibrella rubiginis TaxID=2817060 RepID=A0A939GGZ8_9BACT|nr:glycosyltransferase family 2 protein [Fibrella rubiginis]MBO0938839.1 glycosyltransferase family 2 protein [Fibrella rubiginis]